nr:MAG TPA: cysteine-rich protein [Caudoviricetes sp.]
MKYKPKTIYCPQCNRKVGTHDGRSTNNLICRCKKCKKRVIYYPATMETEVKPLPKRTTSSGMTFI